MKSIIYGVALALLAGCAATTEELEQTGDGYQVGFQDGITGHTSRGMKALKAQGSLNLEDYERGYWQGIAQYCNSDFAYQMGLSGQYYEGVCEGTEHGQKFRMEWQRGWNAYSNAK